MTGLRVCGRTDRTVPVALRDDLMAQGLTDLRWHLPTPLAGGLSRTGLASVFEIESRVP